MPTTITPPDGPLLLARSQRSGETQATASRSAGVSDDLLVFWYCLRHQIGVVVLHVLFGQDGQLLQIIKSSDVCRCKFQRLETATIERHRVVAVMDKGMQTLIAVSIDLVQTPEGSSLYLL